MPPGLLSLGIAQADAGVTSGPGWTSSVSHDPSRGVRHSPGWACGHEAAFRTVVACASRGQAPTAKVWTDRVRRSGRSRRKKQMWYEMTWRRVGACVRPRPFLGRCASG